MAILSRTPTSSRPGHADASAGGGTWLRSTTILVALLAVVLVGGYFAFVKYRATQAARLVRELTGAGDLERASEALSRWLAAEPGSGEAYYYKARLALAADQPVEATAAIEQASRLGFDRSQLSCLTAIIRARANQFTEAEPVLVQAYQKSLEPRADVAQELARIYLSTFRLNEAAGPIERWRSLAPADARPYLWRNEIESRSEAIPAILIQNYRAALDRDPGLDGARLGLAEQLTKERRFEEAEREYQECLERNPGNVTALIGLARNAFQQGDIEESARHFEAALKVDPKQADALKELAQIDLRRGRHRQARERLEVLTKLEPFDPSIRYSFSQALKLTGDLARSKVEAERADQLRKDNEQLAELRNVLLLRPRDAKARYDVAKWMLDHGHDSEGLVWTQEILRAEPRHAPTHRLLQDYYTKQGNMGLANYHRLLTSSESDAKP